MLKCFNWGYVIILKGYSGFWVKKGLEGVG